MMTKLELLRRGEEIDDLMVKAHSALDKGDIAEALRIRNVLAGRRDELLKKTHQ